MLEKQLALVNGEWVGQQSQPSLWTTSHVQSIFLKPGHIAPIIKQDDFAPVSPDLDIWDAWPIQKRDGSQAKLPGDVFLWMALAAPHQQNPEDRHGLARIHMFQRDAKGWLHLGPVMPEGFSPGSREWSGSAVLDEDDRSLTLYFTAAGHSGEIVQTYLQRLFCAHATLEGEKGEYKFTHWRGLGEFIPHKPAWYMASDAGTGRLGTIKAYRDPFYFFDPVTALNHVFFTASLANSTSSYNGVVGAAVQDGRQGGDWTVLPPLLSADALNNELERPHVIYHHEKYYLFWSTQSHVFNPDTAQGPTGLYGMSADRITGPWEPLNGTGLVFSNPPEAPAQAYSWLVMPDLSVASFVDNWGQPASGALRRFGGSFAPELHLQIDGNEARLAD